MRRLLRISFNAATMLSLLLCLAMTALWLLSYRRTYELHRVFLYAVDPPGHGIAEHTVGAEAAAGGLEFYSECDQSRAWIPEPGVTEQQFIEGYHPPQLDWHYRADADPPPGRFQRLHPSRHARQRQF
jgi:hypothetical protein